MDQVIEAIERCDALHLTEPELLACAAVIAQIQTGTPVTAEDAELVRRVIKAMTTDG